MGLIFITIVMLMGCSSAKDANPNTSSEETSLTNESSDNPDLAEGSQNSSEETEIQVFIAASLNTVMTELAEAYHEICPNVKIVYNADRRRL